MLDVFIEMLSELLPTYREDYLRFKGSSTARGEEVPTHIELYRSLLPNEKNEVLVTVRDLNARFLGYGPPAITCVLTLSYLPIEMPQGLLWFRGRMLREACAKRKELNALEKSLARY
jgi:hypothetical protein